MFNASLPMTYYDNKGHLRSSERFAFNFRTWTTTQLRNAVHWTKTAAHCFRTTVLNRVASKEVSLQMTLSETILVLRSLVLTVQR